MKRKRKGSQPKLKALDKMLER